MIGFPIGSMEASMADDFPCVAFLAGDGGPLRDEVQVLAAAHDLFFRPALGDGDVAFENRVVGIDADLIGPVRAEEILDLFPVAQDPIITGDLIGGDHHRREIRREVGLQKFEVALGDGLFIGRAQASEGVLVLLVREQGQA